MKLDQSLAQQILAIISPLIASDCKIILFGSYATGLATATSDIDIAIKSKTILDTATWSLIEEKFEESDIIARVEIVDYHRVKAAFQKIIDKEGIDLENYVQD